MRKKFWILILTIVGMALQSCSFDDQPLWDAVEDLEGRLEQLEQVVKDMNSDLTELQKLVAAMENNVTVKDVSVRGDGYEIRLSNGTVIVIKNGQDGKPGEDGKDAPEISIKKDLDGVYYWTIGGEWLRDSQGEKIPVEGKDGQDGQDGQNAPVPQFRVNGETGEWEISVDGGLTWEKTGMFADGEGDGNADGGIFSGVDNSNPDFVIVTLHDGTELKLDRYTEGAFSFIMADAEGVQNFVFGENRTYAVEAEGIADFSISKPDGWKVAYDGAVVTVTAVEEDNVYGEKEGVIAFNLVSDNGKSMIVKMEVVSFGVNVLTFEDEDWKGTPYTLDYCSASINTWSDLVPDSEAFGDLKLYGADYMDGEAMYMWQDENNTMLSHIFPDAMPDGSGMSMMCFMYGGHAISNYVKTDIKNTDYNNQLSVPTADPVTGKGGHNGSENFAVHFGYSGSMMCAHRPALMFMDGVARVIDHMYVTNITYTLNSIMNGDGMSDPFKAGDWYKIIAIGYDENFEECSRCEFMMANGPDQVVTDWTKWDLSSLGKVAMVEFDVDGNVANDWGLITPAYFAYDDVAVRK